MNFHVSLQIFHSVKSLAAYWTHLIQIFQMILANVTIKLVLSRVTLSTDITYILDTLISGFFSQMDDIDVILKSCLGPALVDAVFMGTEVGGPVLL